MSDKKLKRDLIRLAYSKAELRGVLLPLLRREAGNPEQWLSTREKIREDKPPSARQVQYIEGLLDDFHEMLQDNRYWGKIVGPYWGQMFPQLPVGQREIKRYITNSLQASEFIEHLKRTYKSEFGF